MIIKLEECSQEQKRQFMDIFSDCFLKERSKKYIEQEKAVFADAFLEKNAAVYIINDNVAGFVAYSDSEHTAVRFDRRYCREQFGIIFGLIMYRALVSIFQETRVKKKDEGYIDFLGVHENFRRKGIATKLLEYAYAQHNKKYYVLMVMHKNKDAINLYHKLGYRLIETRKRLVMTTFKKDYEDIMRLIRRV